MKSIWQSALTGCATIALGAGLAIAKRPTTLPSSNWAPPVTDAPAKRVGGAARACRADPELLVSLLAPSASVGFTAKSQPTLYWDLSKPTNRPIEITLTPRGEGGKDIGAAPLLDVIIPKTEAGGVQTLSLAKPPGNQAPVSLEPGVQYDWVVEVVVHDRSGSDNPTAATRLQRIKAPGAAIAPQSAALEDQYEADRQSGLWYDMLDSLNRMIDQDSENAGLRQIRQTLLKDQNLLEDKDGKIKEIPKTQ